MSIFNWGKKEEPKVNDREIIDDENLEEEEELKNFPIISADPQPKSNNLVVRPNRSIAPVKKPSNDIVVRESRRELVEYRPRTISIGGEQVKVSMKELIRGIKRVTQTIGEYKGSEAPYSKFVIHGLRKVRADMASELAHHFGIHFEIEEDTGKSVFYR